MGLFNIERGGGVYLDALDGHPRHRDNGKLGRLPVNNVVDVAEKPLQVPAHRLRVGGKGVGVLPLLCVGRGPRHGRLGHNVVGWYAQHKRDVPGVFLQKHGDVLCVRLRLRVRWCILFVRGTMWMQGTPGSSVSRKPLVHVQMRDIPAIDTMVDHTDDDEKAPLQAHQDQDQGSKQQQQQSSSQGHAMPMWWRVSSAIYARTRGIERCWGLV